MGIWTASIAERLLLIYRWTPFPAMSSRDPPQGGCHYTSSDLYLFPAAGLLFQPRAAEILQTGALQLDISELPFRLQLAFSLAQGK